MRDKYKLKDLQLHKEETENTVGWYLSAVYQHENEVGIYEITIPKIWLPISYGEPIIMTSVRKINRCSESIIDLGFGELTILNDDQGRKVYEKLIEEKIHDMTLDEIEKKLGFKVRVVRKKEKTDANKRPN